MSGLLHTFEVNDRTWLYNATDSRLYRVKSREVSLNSPDAEIAFGWPEAQVRARLTSGPAILMLNVTEQCNLRCRYCVYSGSYPHERVHGDSRMSESVALRAVDALMEWRDKATDLVTIGFYGGEPLEAFGVIQRVVEYVKERYPERKCRFTLTTNATLINDDIARFLVRERILLGVSLDGPQSVHDANRVSASQRGTWRVVMEHLGRLRDLNPAYYGECVGVLAVLADPRRLAEVRDFFTTEPLVDDVSLVVNPVNRFDADSAVDPGLSPAEKQVVEDRIEDLARQFAEQVLTQPDHVDRFAEAMFGRRVRAIHCRSVASLPEERLPGQLCVPGADRLFVSTMGQFHPCEKLSGAFPIGDLESGFDADACLALIREFTALSRADCSDCWALRLCGACHATARRADRLSAERKRESCSTVRPQIDRALRIYVSVAERDRSAWSQFFAARRDNPFEKLVD